MSNYRKVKGENRLILYPSYGGKIYDKLTPNIYKIGNAGSMFSGIVPSFELVKERDKLVEFKTGIVSKVIEQTNNFFSPESRIAYEELKISHKMGVLFYGKAGTGKTSTCTLIMKTLAETHNAVCFDCTGKRIDFVIHCVKEVRKVQDNPIVLFMDEFEASVKAEEESYLTFLDGTDSIDNLIFIACTNYLEKIPNRIKNRRSRIKHLHNINSLPDAVYKEYILDRVPSMNPETITKFVYLAAENGLTIDELKHALIDYRIEKVSVDKAVKGAIDFNSNETKEIKKEEEED
jgi:ATP-dependent 26S proteasome regulatory subunit